MGDLAISTVDNNYKKIKDIKSEDRTYNNTILALENGSFDQVNNLHLDDLLLQIHLLGNVHTDKDIRESCQNVEEKVGKAMIDLSMDRGLYVAVEEYYHGNFKKEKINKDDGVLTQEKIKLLDDIRTDQRRMGFALNQNDFKKLKKIWQTLSSLSNRFRNNINNYEDYILCTKEELDGCSDRFISSLSKLNLFHGEGAAGGRGSMYKISLDYPEAGPFMSQATNRDKRKELSDKLAKKGGRKNLNILSKMILLRRSASNLLSYANYVDYKVEDRMAKNKDNVIELLNKVKLNIIDQSQKDFKSIISFAKKELNIKDPTYYDYGYIVDQMEKSIYKIDTEELRLYFETDKVIAYMLDLFAHLFDFKYEEINTKIKNSNIKLWHDDVKLFKIQSQSSKDINKNNVSYLILDLYPREGKYGHAAAFNIKGHEEKQIALVCNFPRPSTDVNGKHIPSLLSLGEVETLYHEFGHATHFMLSDTELETHNGFNVAWDFVETPSQMLEEWVLNRDELYKLGSHFQTGERLNGNIIDNVIKSKKFLSAYGWMRQIVMSELDICLHLGIKSTSEKSKNISDIKPEELYQKMVKKYIGNDMSPKSLFPASWGHMDGYDAGYYSYLWAKVYALDFYSIFEKAKIKNGVDSPEYLAIGYKYKKEILEAGASRDESVSARAFLGRAMNDKAFVKSL